MAFAPDRVTTVTFDSYSTLVDVNPEVFKRALSEVTDDPAPVARLWRQRSLEYARTSNYVGNYRPFYEFNRAALRYALSVHDIETTSEQRQEIVSIYHDLEPFDDVHGAVQRLVEAGYECWIISNGDPEMLASLVDSVGIDDLLSGTISADEIQRYKPAVELYQHAAGRTGTPIREICHVTAGWSDVLGAMNAGMQAGWVTREGKPWETFGSDPDIIVPDIETYADTLLDPDAPDRQL